MPGKWTTLTEENNAKGFNCIHHILQELWHLYCLPIILSHLITYKKTS